MTGASPGAIRRELERLRKTATQGTGQRSYETPLYMDVFFKELENIERREAGLEELPYTDEELAYIREADERLLEEYIPHLMRTEVSEESREFARQLEAHIREKLDERS